VVTFIAASRRVKVSSTGAGDCGGHVGQKEAQPLVVDDLAAERRSFVGVGGGVVQGGLRETHRDGCDAEPPRVQPGKRDLQALPFRTDQTVSGMRAWS
jgi:hypothetical protein